MGQPGMATVVSCRIWGSQMADQYSLLAEAHEGHTRPRGAVSRFDSSDLADPISRVARVRSYSTP